MKTYIIRLSDSFGFTRLTVVRAGSECEAVKNVFFNNNEFVTEIKEV